MLGISVASNDGAPDVTHFAVKEEMVPLKIDANNHTNNLLIVKNLYISVDPYHLNLMKSQKYSSNQILPPILPGQAIPSVGVGRVLDSVHPDFKTGDLAFGMLSWAQYTIVPSGVEPMLQKLDDKMGFPLPYYAGILGYSGITAYGGFFKVKFLKKELGFDEVFNYKEETNLSAALQ
ncbi:zinc-binding dehydrogenase family protein, partial [Striga asiatica]